ncbi:MAG: hypothetical protein RI943_1323, partial [Bacteroidota bacterium]
NNCEFFGTSNFLLQPEKDMLIRVIRNRILLFEIIFICFKRFKMAYNVSQLAEVAD